MATYSSYKKVDGSSLAPQSIPANAVDPDARKTFGVKWIYGTPTACSQGCCCLWSVPTGVTKVFFEIWGAGGSGSGACSTSRCHHYAGGAGGGYNSKMITTTPATQYTVCAAGNGNCCVRECVGCQGCSSYVNGTGLSGFCAVGGKGGCANTSWNTACNSTWSCCRQAGDNGGDFGYMNHEGAFGAVEWWFGVGFCHCNHNNTRSTSAPKIGTDVQMAIQTCWMRCGCWTVPYGHGGQNAMSGYCGGSSCCGTGGMGGPGLVKITYY